MSAQPVDGWLDPDRPFARVMRGEDDVVIEQQDAQQWVEDWLGWVGLTAEDLLDRHDRRDYEGFKDRHVWCVIGEYLERRRRDGATGHALG